VVAATLKALQATEKPYKYVVSCTIMQKTGAVCPSLSFLLS
jgi:hypothetical protein